MLINAVRSIRAQFLPCYSSPLTSTRKAAGVRFSQAFAGKDHPKTSDKKMDKQQEELPKAENTRDTMSSFGEGYATRSEEEGFGGIYSGNQSLVSTEDEDKIVQAKAPDFEHSQGSLVKEKERARNQGKVVTSS